MQDAVFLLHDSKILIVDDTPENVQLLAGMLKNRGFKIRTALSGKLALQAAQNDPPDLILLDISMPEMDGFELCQRLKQDFKLKEIPIIFISALSETEDKVKAFSLGGVDYMTKPFHLAEVEARVETHLMLKAAREYLKEKNQFLEYTFSRYVSPQVLEQLKKKPVSEYLKMERRMVTILFADLRGSSSLALRLTPEEIQETIASALEVMIECIEAADGMIDKFLGDGLMAIFGAPIKQEDHAWRAVQAAVALQCSHQGWMKKRKTEAKPATQLGIGLAAGEVIVGNIGTLRRMEYTALGQAVNLAAYLVASAEGGEILTTPFTRDHAQLQQMAAGKEGGPTLPFSYVPKGKLCFKNIQEPVEVIAISMTAKETG